MLDKPFYHRLAELHAKGKKRKLSTVEYTEMMHCLDLHIDMMYAMSMCKNMSFLAHSTDDRDWQIEICAEVQKFTEDPTAIKWEEHK